MNNDFCINYIDYYKSNNYSLEGLTRHISTCIPEQSCILAWSLGGLFAINVAYNYPNKIHKLILVASQPKFLSERNWTGINIKQYKAMQSSLSKNYNKHLNHFLRTVNYPSTKINCKTQLQKHRLAMNKNKALQLLNLMESIDLRIEYSKLNIEILHVIFTADAILSQNIPNLKQLNPKIKATSIEHAGHAGFLTHRNEFLDILYKFIYDK